MMLCSKRIKVPLWSNSEVIITDLDVRVGKGLIEKLVGKWLRGLVREEGTIRVAKVDVRLPNILTMKKLFLSSSNAQQNNNLNCFYRFWPTKAVKIVCKYELPNYSFGS